MPKIEYKSMEADLKRLAPGYEKILDQTADQVKDGFQATECWLELKDRPILHVPWKNMRYSLGGLRQGELTVLTGDTGHGKTTFAANMIFGLMKKKTKTLTFSLEMGMIAFIKKIFQMYMQIVHSNENLEKNLETWTEWIIKNPIWILNHSGPLRFDSFKRGLVWAGIVLEAQCVLVDHFHLLTKPGMDASQLERMVAEIRQLADTLGIAVLMICHPAKIHSVDGKEREIGMDELKGSSGIKQYADNILAIYFDKPKNLTTVRIHKVRESNYGKNMGLKIQYSMNQNLLFEELDDGTKD